MAIVYITEDLFKKIKKEFKSNANKVIDLLESLESDPKKGKCISNIGNIVIKEIKYKVYRFYFITDGYKVKFLKHEELTDLVIKFVRMSDKDGQQVVIDEIKDVLRNFGADGF